jgi:cytochrome c peroxidase
MKRIIFITIMVFALILMVGWVAGTSAQQSTLKPPLPDLTGIVKDKTWAIALGKALFWDQQVGSDGQSCASCHFHAGADTRLKNQITPGFLDVTYGPDGDDRFGSIRSDTGTIPPGYMPSGALARSNYTLVPEDFPMHKLVDHTNRNSAIITTTNDRISSQGSFDSTFGRVGRLRIRDWCRKPNGDIFHAGWYPARQVEPRNTPTTVNAVFNHRNFWDGRANNMFNGVGVFGMRDINGPDTDPKKRILVVNASGKLEKTYLTLENASLASQAVGPPLSEKEMSCDGRDFRDVGRKMLLRVPLALQKVHAQDSVLGSLRSATGRGLKVQYLYRELIKKAFEDKYWKATGRYEITDTGVRSAPILGYTQMEHNFSMFWGIAIMLYEATLVSDQSETDSLIAAGRLVVTPNFAPAGPAIGGCTSPTGDVDPLLLRGCTIFARAAGAGPTGTPPTPLPSDGIRGGNCFICHNAPGGGVGRPVPPLLSQATLQQGETFAPMIQVGKNLGGVHRHDQGFMSIGLRTAFSDLMTGGTDPYNNPLSFSRQYQNYLQLGTPIVDPFLQKLIDAGTPPLGGVPAPTLGTDGGSKAPILRNVALTPPYFSWGGYANLRQVMELYNRGLSRRDIAAADGYANRNPGTLCTSGDDTGTGPDGNVPYPLTGVTDCNTNVTATILPLGLLDCNAPGSDCATKGRTVNDDDLAALVRFMKSLTDYRVQCDQAPFDHPALFVFNGHRETDANRDGRADDIIFELPEVGASGYSPASGFCIPNAADLFAAGMQSRSGGPRVPLQ